MFTGFCTTKPLSSPLRSGSRKLRAVVEADEGDRAGLADVLQREQHAGGRRLVGREDAVDARREAIEQVLGRPLRRVARRAGVLVRRDHRHAREAALQLGQEARLALLRGRRSLLVAQHQDGALALQQLAHAPAGEVPALAVVGAHVAHGRMRRLERGVEDDGGNARARGFLDRPLQGPAVERREHDPLDALADEALDDLDLLLAVVLADRALPDDADRRPGGRELGGGLLGADADARPVLVRRAFRDDRQRQGRRATRRAAPAGGALAPGLAARAAAARQPGDRQDDGADRANQVLSPLHSAALPIHARRRREALSWPNHVHSLPAMTDTAPERRSLPARVRAGAGHRHHRRLPVDGVGVREDGGPGGHPRRPVPSAVSTAVCALRRARLAGRA